MTDMSETRTIRQITAPQQHSLLSAALAFPFFVAQALGKLMTARARQSPSTHAHSRAERALMKQRLQEESRRKVDRLMM
ncbi:hypothetical protein [Primorskyibacter sp. 2E233]|uniref:hypothetical protein n=1 Tax=Primorskyibacter sp. 2E233 TaxID=3413431 RepID=UPI003BEF57DA